jgi:hypothetical protein
VVAVMVVVVVVVGGGDETLGTGVKTVKKKGDRLYFKVALGLRRRQQ